MLICFDKKFAKVKLNEAEMCSLVAAFTRHNNARINLTVFFSSKNLIFLNGDKQCSILGKSSRQASCSKE